MASEDTDESSKTEEPTGKRLGDAREKGQVAKSREIDHWLMLFAATMAVVIFAPDLAAKVRRTVLFLLAKPHEVTLDGSGLPALLGHLAMQVGLALAPIVGLLIVAAVASGYLQHGFLFAPDLIRPKISKLSPLAGVKRIFSVRGLVEFGKGAIKLAVVGAFGVWLMYDDFQHLEKYIFLDLVQTLQVVLQLALKLLAGILSILAVIAALDFLYQKFNTLKQLRMTREEVREEFKQSEGDPIVKGRLRQLRLERARRRMMAEVPKSDVVITNPTHFAVALKYDQATMAAPKVTAKGTDLVAHKIKDIAIEASVPIVENPPLARALYASVEIDQEVPPEHYKAVAEVIGYVMRLRKGQFGPPPKVLPDDYKGEAPPP